jgi:CheY-like chemotaxis protein
MPAAHAVAPDEEQEQPPTVLLVEDEALVRLSTADELRDYGFSVHEAVDAPQALAILQEERIDVVFTDVNMPGVPDGLGLIEWIHARMPSLRILLTTGDNEVIEAARAACGDEAFFAKPYSVAEVAARIRRLLDGGGGARSGAS